VPDDAPRTAVNPVLPGCHPDPSTCRVRDGYYLVTSTFEYFPGLPIFHSRDLIHWRQLGHAIDRAEQLDLSGVPSSGGLLAATLRHHDGVFYLVNTLVHAGDGVAGGNYYSRPTIRGPLVGPGPVERRRRDRPLALLRRRRPRLVRRYPSEPRAGLGRTDGCVDERWVSTVLAG
jgi:beta-xylosidase